jgi:hypothetical protein
VAESCRAQELSLLALDADRFILRIESQHLASTAMDSRTGAGPLLHLLHWHVATRKLALSRYR